MTKMRGSLVTRTMQRYNIESRTEKLLEKDQVVPRPAPKFRSDKELLEEIRRTQPEIAEAATKKDDHFHKRLQDVFVTSTDPVKFDPDSLKQVENPDRPLPRRSIRERGDDLVSQHPFSERFEEIPKGKIHLEDAQEMLNRYRAAIPSNRIDAKTASEMYSVSAKDAAAVMDHFAIFSLWTNTDKEKPQVKDPLLPQPDWEERPDPETEKAKAREGQLPGKAREKP